MGLDDLVARIELLRARIRSHNTALRENETRTRMALIDPLLHALGWDVSDPGVVTPEYKVSDGWADYALLRPNGQPAATVEAKKLGEPLMSHRMQMLNYANASGIDYAGLTDGNHWELYNVFKRGQLEERRILEVSIANDPAHESALKLLLLWRPNLESGQPVAARASILAEARRPTPKLPSVEQAPVPRLESGGKGMGAFSFTLNGQKVSCKNGKELLVAIFSEFAERDETFCERFAERVFGRRRKYVARAKEDLYPDHPEYLIHNAVKLPGGWWLGTHAGNSQKMKLIRAACEVARIKFGREITVYMP